MNDQPGEVMQRWWKSILLVAALSLATSAVGRADALAPARPTLERSPSPTVTVSAPSSVTEGDRYRVVAKGSPLRDARRITFQQYLPEYGTYGDLMWKDVRTRRVAGSQSLVLKLVADASSTQRTRAVITFSSGKKLTSKPTTVKIWHWTDLSDFSSYYSTSYVYSFANANFAMNGDPWRGWLTYAHPVAWESRYTPGRNCKAFRGTLGVTDDSSDGVSASISLFTDETTLAYTSPALVPGSVTPINLKLDRPYRFSIQAHDTTDSGTAHNVYPAIGAPQFLCHFG